jgi:hypothetical protein
MGATGRNTVTAIAEQASEGSDETTLDKLLATSNSLDIDVQTTKSEALTGNRFGDDSYVSGSSISGSIDSEVSQMTLPMIIKHGIGPEDATPEDVNTDASCFLHTFTPDQELPGWLTFLKWFTDEQYYEKYVDCRINQFSLTLTSQSILTYSMDIVGKSGTSDTVDPTDTVEENVGGKLFAWQAVASMDEVDVTQQIDEFSLTHNNSIDTDDFGLSKTPRSLDAQGSEHTFNLTLQFDKAIYEGLKSDLQNGLVVPLTIDIGDYGDTSNTPILTITYPKAKLTEVSADVSGPDKITATVNGEALWDNATEDANVKFKFADDQDTMY